MRQSSYLTPSLECGLALLISLEQTECDTMRLTRPGQKSLYKFCQALSLGTFILRFFSSHVSRSVACKPPWSTENCIETIWRDRQTDTHTHRYTKIQRDRVIPTHAAPLYLEWIDKGGCQIPSCQRKSEVSK